jgi:hypothetical protein
MFGRGRGRGRKAQQPVFVPAPVLVEDVWVQCDNPDCKKWRKLPPGSKAPPEDVEWWGLAGESTDRGRFVAPGTPETRGGQ